MRNTLPASLPRPVPSDMSNVLEDQASQAVRIVPLGHDDRRQRVRVLAAAPRTRSPGPTPRTAARVASPCRGCRANTVRSPSSCSIASASRSAVEQIRRRRVREKPDACCLQHLLPVPVRPRQPAPSCWRPAPSADTALNPSPGGSISPFCEPRDGDVDPPLVVPVVDRAERRNRVDDQQRRMARAVHRAPKVRNAARDAGGRFVVNDDDGLDRVRRCRRAVAPRAFPAMRPRRQVPGTYSTARPSFSATCRQAMCENQPVSMIRTRSPGDRVLTSAASHAPVPDAG